MLCVEQASCSNHFTPCGKVTAAASAKKAHVTLSWPCCSCHSSRLESLYLQLSLHLFQRYRTFPDKLHQPSMKYKFPKRMFGPKKPVYHSFQSAGFSQWPFLHYSEVNDVVHSHTCLLAFKQKKMSKHNADPAFVSKC